MKRSLILTVILALVIAGCTARNDGNDADNGNGGAGGGGASEAIVAASPSAPRVNESVSFKAQGAGASDNVQWQFGDGTNATGANATHAYALPGSYIVRLAINNSGGSFNNEGTLTYLTVSEAETNLTDLANAQSRAPSAVIVLDRQVIQPGGNVTVNASGSSAFIANEDFNETIGLTPSNLPFVRDASATSNLTYAWDFGDGTKASTLEANHTYAAAGLYVITLTVTDATGAAGRAAASVLVLSSGQPVGGFKNKDLYVTATITGPQSFDPGFDYESAGGNVIQQVYETLFATDRGNPDRIIPSLAAEVPTVANGGIKENGTVYVIKLKQGVKFHDGTAFNASAVKFSFDRAILMNDPSSGASVLAPILKGAREFRNDENNTNSKAERDAWLALEAVKVIDEYTVQITLDAPNAAFFQRLAFYGTSIMSPTAVKACRQERVALWGVCQTPDGLPPASDGSGRSITRDPWADTNMVGTGPFKLRKWLPGDRVILDRNEEWHQNPKPALRTVIIQYVDDLNTRLLMLRSGDADEIYVSPADLDRVRPSIQGIAKFTAADTLIIDAFFFNYDVEDQEQCPTLANGQKDCKFFQDINVRKAFAHAFDSQTFFNDVWKGRAKPLAGVIPRGMPGYDDSLAPYARDEAAAKAALAQSKGKDGFTVACVFNTGNTVRQGACELMKKNLEALMPGKITVNVQPLPFDTVLDKTQKQQIAFWILGWSPDYIATDDYIEPFLHSRGNYPVQQNFKDEELERLIDAALLETDAAKQAAAYKEINRLAVERYVDVFLDQRSSTNVARTYVQGYYYSPLHSGSPNTGDYTTISKA